MKMNKNLEFRFAVALMMISRFWVSRGNRLSSILAMSGNNRTKLLIQPPAICSTICSAMTEEQKECIERARRTKKMMPFFFNNGKARWHSDFWFLLFRFPSCFQSERQLFIATLLIPLEPLPVTQQSILYNQISRNLCCVNLNDKREIIDTQPFLE